MASPSYGRSQTPSSAIFYGSLAVHLGVFLMLRTFPFWEEQTSVRILIAAMGLFTAIITTGIGRVQSSVKSQIAYASAAQIGLIFIEVAAGFESLALFHFAGNAFLRTYQLLVSPSVVSYLIREQFYNFSARAGSVEAGFPAKIKIHSLYSLYKRMESGFHDVHLFVEIRLSGWAIKLISSH